jgi:ferredoxin-NADP reductase
LVRKGNDFYALDILREMLAAAPNLRIILTAESGDAALATVERLSTARGVVLDTLRGDDILLAHRDIHVAGPPTMLRELAHALGDLGVDAARIHIDSFGF